MRVFQGAGTYFLFKGGGGLRREDLGEINGGMGVTWGVGGGGDWEEKGGGGGGRGEGLDQEVGREEGCGGGLRRYGWHWLSCATFKSFLVCFFFGGFIVLLENVSFILSRYHYR